MFKTETKVSKQCKEFKKTSASDEIFEHNIKISTAVLRRIARQKV